MHMNMHRFRARVFLRSISLCKSKWHQHHGAQIHFSQNRTSTGPGFVEFETEPSMQMQVLKALCSGERKKASDLLLDFGSRTHSLTADDFLHIFKYCARSPDPLFVMEIRRFMELKGVSMNIICSSLMIEALCKGGCLEEAFHVMDSLGGSQCLYPVLPLYNSLLGSCTKMQSLIQANKCLDIMEKKIVGRSEVTYTELLKMENLGLQPSCHTYNGIIKAAVSHGNVGDAIGVLKKMQQKKLKPNDSTLATLSITCSKALQLDLAEAFLNQISECLYPHPYNALLASCDELNQPERAVQVFAKMKQKKVLPNIRTCELLFSLFGVVNAPYEDSDILSQVDAAKRINAIQKDMATNGIKHSHLSIKNILKALGEEGMIRELIQYLHLAENLFIYQNPSSGTHMYNTVLHYLVEAKESDMAIAVFKKMKLCGCNPDSETYNIMIDCCTIIQSYRSACLLISMMIRKGFCPVICTYTAIIKILLEDDNFDEALNLLKQVKLDGIQPDVLLFNTVLKQACYKERIDVIEFIVELMHREKVPPDPRTCGYVFSAYVNSGFHSTAIEALQVLSLRMISEDGNILGEEKKFVNEFILSEDLSAESQILKLFEDSEDELAVGLLNLRWCAIAGFPICESADQSLWARRLEGKRF
ncbi:pentatricopeptide repeat-containing protein At1g76280 isoform X4 [Vigna radiata var. radiata]|uniref:Pentatricopeptide repeat-containing protein At1g76280 isoform X4 n=1 Tax=Vigna radiata var. radiata TaxID=3916 RepID=A0A3Q0F2S0_VIGRR|nr:pentatricopeptide repeat-containing protein At1g76280 isoform X4 [Vigna radiata var. radiata]